MHQGSEYRSFCLPVRLLLNSHRPRDETGLLSRKYRKREPAYRMAPCTLFRVPRRYFEKNLGSRRRLREQ
jgi:hypothetical protein